MTMSIIWDYVVDRRGRGVTALQTKKKTPSVKNDGGCFFNSFSFIGLPKGAGVALRRYILVQIWTRMTVRQRK